MRKSARVFIPSTAFKYTLPPRPPSPPSGPPKGTNFSRRKLDAAAAAVAGLHLEFGFVDEFHGVTQVGAQRAN